MQPDGLNNTCLEIGGPNFIATDILAPHFNRYFIVNTSKNELNNLPLLNIIIPIRGDGCQLPFADKSVDFIFCNAIIEHIHKTKRQLLAKEIQRVCKTGFFISTPNYWFPLEPHYLLPFFQYMPEIMKRFLLRWFSNGYMNHTKNSYAYLQLLTHRKLKALFPNAIRGGIISIDSRDNLRIFN
jgi:SAM-dependent methyltransferase